jgi:hypothetical protein
MILPLAIGYHYFQLNEVEENIYYFIDRKP